jgi:uncharacterized protein YbjQ (UPF0145 family)
MNPTPLTESPPSHSAARESIQRNWSRFVSDSDPAWAGEVDHRATLVGVGDDRVVYASVGGTARKGVSIMFNSLVEIGVDGRTVTLLTATGWSTAIHFAAVPDAESLEAAVNKGRAAWRSAGGDRAPATCGERRQASLDVLVVTMDCVPGYEVVAVHGDVFGAAVMAADLLQHMGADLRNLVGGVSRSYTKVLQESRRDAREEMVAATREAGGNAVLTMRIASSEIGPRMSEILMYGTAATIRPSVAREAEETL